MNSAWKLACHLSHGRTSWLDKLGAMLICAFVLSILLFLVAVYGSFGVEKPGAKFGFRDGTFIYEVQRFHFPRSNWRWYTSDYYAQSTLLLRPSFNQDARFTELAFPMWMLMAALAPLATFGLHRASLKSIGPYRLTTWRYISGCLFCALLLVVATFLLCLFAATLSSDAELRELFAILLVSWISAPLGAYLMAQYLVRRANRRWPANLCWECRYDLTGNVSGVCPECGEKVQRP